MVSILSLFSKLSTLKVVNRYHFHVPWFYKDLNGLVTKVQNFLRIFCEGLKNERED